MGCFKETCGISNLPIRVGDAARMMLIRQNPKENGSMGLHPFSFFTPITFLVKGKYNDYGDLKMSAAEEERFERLIAGTKLPIDRKDMGRGFSKLGVFTWFVREEIFQMMENLPRYSYSADFKTRTQVPLSSKMAYELETVTLILEKQQGIIAAAKAAVDAANTPEEKKDAKRELTRATWGAYESEYITDDGKRWYQPHSDNISIFASNLSMRPGEIYEKLQTQSLENLLKDYIRPYWEIRLIMKSMHILGRKMIPLSTGSQDIDDEAQAVLAQHMLAWVKETQDRYGNYD